MRVDWSRQIGRVLSLSSPNISMMTYNEMLPI